MSNQTVEAQQSWDSIEAYLEDNPSASSRLWGRLQYGHVLNTGHEWEGSLHLSVDGILFYRRTCCGEYSGA